MLYLLLILLFFVPHLAHGQSKGENTPRPRLLHLTVDNDAFLFSKIDQYYSSGIYFKYGVKKKAENNSENLALHTASYFGFAHQVYTPKRFNSWYMSDYDRPHAGLLMADFTQIIAKQDLLVHWGGAVGWMGPQLRTGEMLTWWHNIFQYKEPRGWRYEINDSPILQASIGVSKTMVKSAKMDWNAGFEANGGSIYTNGKIMTNLRFGRFLPLEKSMLYNQRFDEVASDKKKVESYFLLGGDILHVFYNATIQGNIIGERSLHVEGLKPWVSQYYFGYGMSGSKIDCLLLLYHRTVEVVNAKKHKFVSIKLNYRL